MIDINEAMEIVKEQIDQWDAEGVLEERLKEYGFKIIVSNSESSPNAEKNPSP